MHHLDELDWRMTKSPATQAFPTKDPLLKEIGIRVRFARREHKLTQTELATKVGAHQTTISSVETGDADVRLMTLVRIAQALNLDFVDLLPLEARGAGQADLAKATRDLAAIADWMSQAGSALRQADAKVASLRKWAESGGVAGSLGAGAADGAEEDEEQA